jgi:hypothetical protein
MARGLSSEASRDARQHTHACSLEHHLCEPLSAQRLALGHFYFCRSNVVDRRKSRHHCGVVSGPCRVLYSDIYHLRTSAALHNLASMLLKGYDAYNTVSPYIISMIEPARN